MNIKTLYRLGLYKINDESKLDLVEKIFVTSQKPLCTVNIMDKMMEVKSNIYKKKEKVELQVKITLNIPEVVPSKLKPSPADEGF